VRDETRELITTFIRDLEQAQASVMTVLTNSLYHNATTLNAKTGWYDTQAADKILSKGATRDEWYERRHMTGESVVTHLHENSALEALPVDALEALISSSTPALNEPSSISPDNG
jgi:hypothetical protein